MKLLTIRIEKSNLQLAEVNHSGRKIHINKMRLFPLPEDLENAGYVRNPEGFCDFVASAIQRGKLTKGKTILILDMASVMLKEYNHAKSKRSHLLSLARLEADAVLPDNEGTFIIENEWYGDRLDKDGLQKSAIYAVNEDFVDGISKGLKQRGIKLVAVYPASVAHTDIIKTLLNTKVSGKEFLAENVLAIDFSHQETRISIFQNGLLIHQRADDMMLEEFYRAVSNSFGIPFEEAEDHSLKYGFKEDNEENKRDPEAFESMVQAGITIMTRIARSVRIILSAEELELDQIILSGSASAVPGLPELVNACFGAKCNPIDDYYEVLSKVIDLDGELKGRKNLYQRLVILAGADYKRKKGLNFLTRGIARKRNNRRTKVGSAFILLITLLIMAVLPLNYYITYKDYQNNNASLTSPEYVEVQELLAEQRQLQSRIQAMEEETASLPFGESNLANLLKELQVTLFTGSTINNIAFDKGTETFQVILTTKNLDDFVAAKNRVNEGGTFHVSLPLTIHSAEGSWQCQIMIEVLPEEDQ